MTRHSKGHHRGVALEPIQDTQERGYLEESKWPFLCPKEESSWSRQTFLSVPIQMVGAQVPTKDFQVSASKQPQSNSVALKLLSVFPIQGLVRKRNIWVAGQCSRLLPERRIRDWTEPSIENLTPEFQIGCPSTCF